MLALIQRVSRAQVDVAGETVGRIGPGLLALVCAEPGDDDARVQKMAQKEDPSNFILMPAIGANVSGQIGSVIAGAVLISMLMG